jgi:DNA-binding NarL/FixJ family response regulator
VAERAAAVPERLWRDVPRTAKVRDMSARVLLGNLEPIVRLGMAVVLEEQAIEVIGEEVRPQALVLLAGRLRPDAVVLDLRHAASRALGGRIRAASPDTTVVFWARDEDVMEVVGPDDAEPRRVLSPTQEELRSALAGSRVVR